MLSNKDKKEFLSKYKNLDRQISRGIEELERLNALAVKITPFYSQAPKSTGNPDRLQATVEHIILLKDELNKQTDQYIIMRLGILNAIDTVENDTLKLLLCYRYVDGLTWEQVAVKLNYSYMQICRLHGKALDMIILPQSCYRMLY